MGAFGKYGRWPVLLLVFATSLLGATSANALVCTSVATGNWGAAATWTSAGNCNRIPTAADDVVIAAGHTITMNSNPGSARSLAISGIANWAQGRTLNIGVGGVTINAGGDVTGTANGVLTSTGGLTINSTLTSNTVTITLQTTAAQTISGTGSLARLTVTGAGVTATNIGALTVRTALAGTGRLTNTGTLNLGGTCTITTLTATAVGNTVNYTGVAQPVKATPYYNLGLGGSGTKTLTGVTTIAGNFTMSGTATATVVAAMTIGGKFTIGATNTFSNTTRAVSVAGDFEQNGTFTAGSGVFTLNGGAAVQTISGTGALGFANLTVNNTGGITLARNVTVTSAIVGAVTLTSTCPLSYSLTSNGGATVMHSCASTVVSSINRASANPTTAASVSWTVTFNASVAGVTSGNFALVNGGLGGTPAITSVAGAGTTWTVTASTGTGSGTLGLNMVNSTGVTPAINYLPFTGQVYSVRPITYYHDTTAGVNIGFDGTTNVVSGTNVVIPPIITASLTTANTCAGNARSNSHPAGLYTHSRWYLNTNYATGVVIGANPGGSAFLRGVAAMDTVIVSLYDYDPVAGGKTLIGSSPTITLTGGGASTAYPYTISSPVYTVPAGHRLMLQYDFDQPAATSNARVYCSAASAYISLTEGALPAMPDHFQINHGGSGVNCQAEAVTFSAHDAAHAAFTLTAGTVIDITTSTAHGDWVLSSGTGTLVNNGNGSATYTSGAESSFVLKLKDTFAEAVNINVASGAVTERSGTASVDAPYDQDLTFAPSGFRFVDALDAEAIANQVSASESGTYYLQAISTDTRTGACVNVFANNVDVPNIELAAECVNPSACQAGEAVTLTNNGVATAIADNDSGAVTAYTARTMRFGTNSKAAFTFNYSDVGKIKLHARYDIPRDTTPASLSGNFMAGSTKLPDLSIVSGSNEFVVKPAGFVVSNVQCTTANAANCGAGALAMAAPDAPGDNPAAASAVDLMPDGVTPRTFMPAGRPFSVTVSAVNALGATVPNYGQESPAESVKLTPKLVAGLGLTSNPAIGGSFGAFVNGDATGTAFTWGEVGIITLVPGVADGDYLGAGDTQCDPALPGYGGATACPVSGNVGRFYPDHFDTVVQYDAITRVFMPCPSKPGTDLACPPSGDLAYAWTNVDAAWTYGNAAARNAAAGFVATDIGKIARQADDGTFWELTGIAPTWAPALAGKGFVYSGQPFRVQVTARNLAGGATTNYNNATSFSRLVTLTAWDAAGSLVTENPGGGVLGNIGIVPGAFAAGVAVATPTYTYVVKETAPTNIFIRAADTDGVSSVSAAEGGVMVASGRIKLSNGHGSELLALPLTATVQYFNGNFWATSLTDTVTALAASDFALAFPVAAANKLAACETALAVAGASPAFTLNLSSPGSGNNGWTNLMLNLGAVAAGTRCTAVGGVGAASTTANRPWLQFTPGTNPTARATFGVYKGNDQFIYMRENY